MTSFLTCQSSVSTHQVALLQVSIQQKLEVNANALGEERRMIVSLRERLKKLKLEDVE